jgi:hypothetical protein
MCIRRYAPTTNTRGNSPHVDDECDHEAERPVAVAVLLYPVMPRARNGVSRYSEVES